jgi:hypothetical protein
MAEVIMSRGELFQYLHLCFDVRKAKQLAQNYSIKQTKPRPGWILPGIEVNEDALDDLDMEEPIIFASLLFEERPTHLLIDGADKVSRAMRDAVLIKFVILNLKDSLEIASGCVATLDAMKVKGLKQGYFT